MLKIKTPKLLSELNHIMYIICPDTWYCSVDNLGNFDTLLDEPQIKVPLQSEINKLVC
jgi:hypothetical protein